MGGILLIIALIFLIDLSSHKYLLSTLNSKVTKHEDWNGETPFQLGAHNSMVHEFYRNDAFNQRPNSGVFGRMADQLKLKGYHTATNAAGAGSSMLTGNPLFNNPVRGGEFNEAHYYLSYIF